MKQAGNKSEAFSLKTRIKRLKRDINKWSVLTLTIVFFLALPIIFIGVELFSGPGETWGHIVKYLLPDYIWNSFYLVIVCSFLVLIFGVSSAWFVSRYDFLFRKQMEWLLILPLAIPSYIVGYAYAGIFDYGGSMDLLFRQLGLEFIRIDIMNRAGLAFILSISLFPYVYVSARAFFLNQANNLLEASKMLGVGERKTFFKLMLPLARPAIVAGLVLVLMEVLNDYGAAKYYGVNTFTTGIFRSWFSLEEPQTAVYLSALLILIIFTLILFEKWQVRKIKFTSSKTNSTQIQRKEPKGVMQWVIFSAVSLPIILGFILPVIQLIYWAVITASTVFDMEFIMISLQSFAIAIVSAIITVFFALLLIYFSKWSTLTTIKNISRIGVLGYAIPGAVIAIGIMIPTLALDKWLINMLAKVGVDSGLIINGTLIALLYAYAVRFLAVAYNPIDSTALKVDNSIPDSSKVLGVGNLKTFLKIEFPLIKTGVFSAVILVFIDVMKELPLTLILKPYHIDTLAVKAFEYASDEMVMEASIPSLFIIFTAMIPVIFLNKLLIKK
ncbi:iron(III) transport system permease protein [Winogradskyella epiphytica]|uniref:Iron(III) transport system permease protein n=1 Tax=Winogradskyella epiphytica TaxID=262005 RepID=A0A2V4WU84_9FLAO|nr:iron ABC transporter permease [Winogradskyella epiphytica]PYE79988.1 iron(III) transport system permease protein [Winogradskyella epiphytica]